MESLRKGSTPDPQEELVERYCLEARERLEKASSKEEARAVKELICSRLAGECGSTLVLTATRAYIEDRIRQKWGNEAP